MIVFCAFQQIPNVITEAEKYGFKNYIPLTFCIAPCRTVFWKV